jgi:Dyp-type peroxidase family
MTNGLSSPSESSGSHLPAQGAVAAADEPELRMANIQGNVVAGFKKGLQTLLYFHIDNAELFKGAVSELGTLVATADKVLAFNKDFTSARKENREPPTSIWINVAFTCAGLAKLTSQAALFVDAAFRDGLVKRSAELGDPQASPDGPSNWRVADGDRSNAADVLIIVAADTADDLHNTVDAVTQLVRRNGGATALQADEGRALRGAEAEREHFGFRDGISQPGIRGRVSSKENDLLTPRPRPESKYGERGEALVWPGEFVFGYPDEDGRRAARGPGDWMLDGAGFSIAPEWATDGSYLVFRRLRQNVHLFHQFLNANKGSGTAVALGARVVGRWPSGAPLKRAPTQDIPSLANGNDFVFAPVPGEGTCPDDAHIRKVNPRDDLPDDGSLRHRLVRRGISFGTELISTPDEPGDDDESERGLLFLAYMTSIVDQFEFVMKSWVNRDDFRKPRVGTDALVGRPDRRWIVPTGGGYYFAPSVSALKEVLST